MKQSHKLRCEIVPVVVSLSAGGGTHNVQKKLRETIQERLDKGWTLRAAPTEDGVAYLTFVRKEAKPQ
jgi:hypothetical protein